MAIFEFMAKGWWELAVVLSPLIIVGLILDNIIGNICRTIIAWRKEK